MKKVKEPNLTEVECLKIELMLERKLKSELEFQVVSLNHKVAMLELKQLDQKKVNAQNNLNNVTNSYLDFIQTLSKKYNIKNSKWGFDPVSGKIITD